MAIAARIGSYFSLVKFSHTIFAMPFAMIGFMLAASKSGLPLNRLLSLLGLVVLCMVLARSAAMAFNRYLDRRFDALNPRTAMREVPAGIITPQSALLFTIICAICFSLTTLFINLLCFYLSFVALFVILFYSYTKRFTALCHLVLGLGLSLAPIGAYLAVAGSFSPLPVLFSGLVMAWVSGFDIMYALQDAEFDKSQNLHSIPAYLGIKGALNVSNMLHLFAAAMVVAIGIFGQLGILYWAGAAVYTGLLWYQHRLVKPTDLSRVNQAFSTVNGIAGIVFALFVMASVLLKG